MPKGKLVTIAKAAALVLGVLWVSKKVKWIDEDLLGLYRGSAEDYWF